MTDRCSSTHIAILKLKLLRRFLPDGGTLRNCYVLIVYIALSEHHTTLTKLVIISSILGIVSSYVAYHV